jgi:DNA-binding FrmR family transcriptional regulator
LARQLANLLEGQIRGLASVAEATREQTQVLQQLPEQVRAAVAEGLHSLAVDVAQRVVSSVLLEALQTHPTRVEGSGAKPAPDPKAGLSQGAQDRLAEAKARVLLALAGALTALAVGLGGGYLAWGGGPVRPIPAHPTPGGAP